jgi:hypothetical protein
MKKKSGIFIDLEPAHGPTQAQTLSNCGRSGPLFADFALTHPALKYWRGGFGHCFLAQTQPIWILNVTCLPLMTPFCLGWKVTCTEKSHIKDWSHDSFFILFFFFTNTGHLSAQPHHMAAQHGFFSVVQVTWIHSHSHMYAQPHHMTALPPLSPPAKNASVVLPLELKSLIFIFFYRKEALLQLFSPSSSDFVLSHCTSCWSS